MEPLSISWLHNTSISYARHRLWSITLYAEDLLEYLYWSLIESVATDS